MKKEKTPLKKLIKRDRYLILMVMPCVLYFLIFHYVPMVWNIVAFQDYNVRKGILGSSWVGLENFKRFFESPYAFRLIRNTFMLSFMDLILGFPVPIRVWLKEDKYYNIIKEAFTSEAAAKYFNTDKIMKYLDDHKNGKGDYSRKIWTVYMFLIWHKRFFEDEKAA